MNLKKNEVNVTIMGGEPLLAKNHSQIEQIVKTIKANEYSYNVITNGVNLHEFIELFKKYTCEFIQITIDGSRNVHDSRRIKKNNKGSFDEIMKNVKLALKYGLRINLRVNLDNHNVNDLINLAKYIIKEFPDRSNLYVYAYPVQDGGCLGQKNIISEKELIDKVIVEKKEYTELSVINFYFHGHELINTIFNNGRHIVKARNCAAFANQYIFDFLGNIYKCWFGVGNDNFKIGTFLPLISINQEIDKAWKERTTKSNQKCKKCKYRFICGGGCISHIFSKVSDINKERCVDFYSIISAQLTQYKELNE